MSRWVAFAISLTLAGCGGTSGGTDGGMPMADAAVDAAVDAALDDAGAVSTAVHDCDDSDFVDLRAGMPDDRMIMVPRGTTTFDFPCITISPGQAVMFMWDFAAHPLQPGVAPGHEGTGSEPNPIVAQTSGSLYEVAFPGAGDYPFYCAMHYLTGMYGVVRVVP